MIKKKICLLGTEGAGKSSLANRFANDSFSEDYKRTIGVKLFNKIIECEGQEVSFIVWDMQGGSELYKQQSYYYEGAFAHLILGDSSDQKSVEEVPIFHKESRATNSDAMVFLCLSKIDLESYAALDQDILNMKKEHEFTDVFKTSSKANNGIDEMFQTLAMKAINNKV